MPFQIWHLWRVQVPQLKKVSIIEKTAKVMVKGFNLLVFKKRAATCGLCNRPYALAI